ncbi:type I restriction-modification system subunit M N-terminal domain-containing protein [Desulfosporosinus metallidurans]|uniref:site-specific DNA-methyltransferase (adenine-specific) n=1 Tax=Desulfosporosinus metallidurans TaxID=1888891 RepID=A0A1Q8QG08_9FIRM|nr:type I restriction-modification system subunit M N-terminal domain-containing protein [Desulfosporosinus metallidurans]OLN26212.1 Type I restriction-modification system, DNA-methyltransferase subunit M [Desulfosporosinus metallidurans]
MSDKLSEAQLESFLNETCDSLRGDRDAEAFMEYVIAILFLKRLNDRFNLDREARRSKLMMNGLTPSQIDEDLERREVYRLFVPKIARWDKVKQQKEELGTYLMEAFAEIDAMNPGCLGLLNTIDFNQRTEKGDKLITSADLVELIKDFENLRLSDDNLDF